MIKKKYEFIFGILIIISLIAIGGKVVYEKIPPKQNKEEKTIYWIVGRNNFNEPENYDNTIKNFNKELKRDKYNIELKVVELGNPNEMNYREELKEYLASGKPADIITLFNSGEDWILGYDYKFIKEGNFIPFDDFDKNEVDILLNKGPKTEWEAVKYNNKIYSIPVSGFIRYPYSYNFNTEKLKYEIKTLNNDVIVEAAKVDGFIFSPINELPFLADIVGLAYINSGVFVDGDTGEINSIYNQKKFINMLQLYNTLYKRGYMKKSTDIDVAMLSEDDKKLLEFIPEDTELSLLPTSYRSASLFSILDKYNQYSVSFKMKTNPNNNSFDVPSYLVSSLCGSTGIYSKSKNGKEAFELLYLANIEEKYSDILLHGMEGSDYTKESGVIKDDSMNFLNRARSFSLFYNRTPIDLSSMSTEDTEFVKAMFPTEDEEFEINSKVLPSPYLGFNFNQDGYEDIIKSVTDIAIKNLDIWKSDNLEAELERVRKELSDAGVEKLTAEVKRQVEEWKKIVE